MILSDSALIELNKRYDLISPFCEEKISKSSENLDIPSKGLSCCGYDCTLAPEFKLAKKTDKTLDILIKNTDDWFEHYENKKSIVIPSGGFVLGRTNEYFKIPNFLTASLYCKSTLARMGLFLPPTISEPGWEGHLVVEIVNLSPFPVEIHSDVGIGQMIFFQLSSPTKNTYDGKYQKQTGITCAKN